MIHCNFIRFVMALPSENSAYLPPKTKLHLLKSEESSQSFILDNTAQKYSPHFKYVGGLNYYYEDSLTLFMYMEMLTKYVNI